MSTTVPPTGADIPPAGSGPATGGHEPPTPHTGPVPAAADDRQAVIARLRHEIDMLDLAARSALARADLYRQAIAALDRMVAHTAPPPDALAPANSTPPRRERQPVHCPTCGNVVEQPRAGRPRIYCSKACRPSIAGARILTDALASPAAALDEARAAVARAGLVAVVHEPPTDEDLATLGRPPVPARLDCAHCGRTFDRPTARAAHERTCAPATHDAIVRSHPGAVMYAGRDAEKLAVSPGGYECDDCGHQTETVVALEGHARRQHDRDLRTAERHRIVRTAS